ncbi:MAG: 3-phosphoshikimate 1-carboxyvinyltransferase, partial [Oscillospiraceae bacterium]
VTALKAAGETVIKNVGRLRFKESDRLSAMVTNLTALGGDVKVVGDCLFIHGGKRLKGGRVSGFGDHRIIMSMAIAAALCDEIIIEGWESVSKSYPMFFEEYKKLGGRAICQQALEKY